MVVVVVVATHRRRPLPVAGVALAGGAIVAVGRIEPPDPILLIGIVGTAASALLRSRSLTAAMLVAIPFGFMIGFSDTLDGSSGLRTLVSLCAAGGAVLLGEFDSAWPRVAPAPLLFLVSVFGLYLAVPDTEGPAALAGSALPIALLGWPSRLARLGVAGGAGCASVFVWVAALGGAGEVLPVLGGIACLGALAGAPIGRRVFGRRRLWSPSTQGRAVVALVGVQFALALTAARGVAAGASGLGRVIALGVVAVGSVAAGTIGPEPEREI